MLTKFSLTILLLFGSTCYGQLVKFEPLRNYTKSGRVVFDDVLSHSDTDEDFGRISSTAHEHTHHASNRLYLKEKGYQDYEYLYVLDNYGFKIRWIKSFRLSDLARKIPAQYRGGDYKSYLIDAQEWHQKNPITVLDEWNAYTIGTMAAIEANEDDFKVNDTGSKMLELGIYSFFLAQMAKQNDVNEFCKLEIKRNILITNKIKMSELTKANLINFKKVAAETFK